MPTATATKAIERAPQKPAGELNESDKAAVTEIEAVIQNCELALADSQSRVAKAFAMAKGIATLRLLITDQMMKDHILPLMNTRLGFKTDKDPARKKNGESPIPYGITVVKECLIEALLRGAYVVGNEFNIIAGQTYLTKEFFIRAVKECQGVTDVVASPGIPQAQGTRTLIRFGLAWKVNGVPDMLKDAEGKPGRTFEIRTDQYSSVDQVIGKATRKAYAAAYQQITGSEITLPEGDADDFVAVQPGSLPQTAEGKTEKAKSRTDARLEQAADEQPGPLTAEDKNGMPGGLPEDGRSEQSNSTDQKTSPLAAPTAYPPGCTLEQLHSLVISLAPTSLPSPDAAFQKIDTFLRISHRKKWDSLSDAERQMTWDAIAAGWFNFTTGKMEPK